MKKILLDEITQRLRQLRARIPDLAKKRPDKIYEIYVLSCFVEAAVRGGFRVTCRDDGGPQQVLAVRGAPGAIYNAQGPNTYLLIGQGQAALELQHGIFINGYSKVPQEADVAVITHVAGERCRNRRTHPACREGLTIAECKFYRPSSRGGTLPLTLGRNLLGLADEFPYSTVLLCTNQSKPAIERMVRMHQHRHREPRRVFPQVVPANRARVDEFCHWLSAELRNCIHGLP